VVPQFKANYIFASFSNDLEIDPENFTGRQTPLYFAAKQKQVEDVKLLIANGASVKNFVYGKTIEDIIKENIPNLDVVKETFPSYSSLKHM
jgi:hypothetical protein